MSPRPPAPLAVPSSPAAVSLGPSKGSLCPNALPAIGRSMDLAATGGGEDVREPDTTRWPAGARGGSGRGASGDRGVPGGRGWRGKERRKGDPGTGALGGRGGERAPPHMDRGPRLGRLAADVDRRAMNTEP